MASFDSGAGGDCSLVACRSGWAACISRGEVPGALPLSPYLMEQRAEIFIYTFLTFVAAWCATGRFEIRGTGGWRIF